MEGATTNHHGLCPQGIPLEEWDGYDNTAVVAVVNSGYSLVLEIMHLLRCIFFIRSRFQVDIWAVHTPGVDNRIVDAFSRNDLHHLFSPVPGAWPQAQSSHHLCERC